MQPLRSCCSQSDAAYACGTKAAIGLFGNIEHGYAVTVHRIPSSLLGTIGAFTEMHAVLLEEPNDQRIAKVDGEDEEAAYRAACMLAESVGIELEDG